MKSYLPWGELITTYWKMGLSVVALLIIGIALYQQTPVIVTNEQKFFEEKTARDVLGSYQARVPKETGAGSFFDPARGIFLEQEISSPKPLSKENAIVTYINKANDNIPLTEDSLLFALVEASLGTRDPLKDSIEKLREGELNLKGMTPPTEALAFHRMSINLLTRYQNLLTIFISVPREDFDANELEDDFAELDLFVSIAKEELKNLQKQYRVSLFPKSTLLYEEVIGNPRPR